MALARLRSIFARLGGPLDRAVGGIVVFASWIVLPMSLLLFLQWPLREWVQHFSREANDLAQVLFAFYISVAITGATRRRTHLAFAAAEGSRPHRGRIAIGRAAALLILLPWSAFVLHAGWSAIAQSVLQLEGFPETFNPGYFLLRVALGLMLVLVLLQALLDGLRPDRGVDR